MIDPRLDPLAATRPVQPNWNLAQIPGIASQWFAPPPPDLAKDNREANADAGAQAAAAAQAAAGGIQNQRDEEDLEAMGNRYKLAPKAEAINRQLKTADALRSYGHSLNTGSTNGGAPNWAGALADVMGGYMSSKERKAAEASAEGLGGQYADIAKTHFRNAPDSYF